MTASVIDRALTNTPELALVDSSVRLYRTDEVFRSGLPSDHVPTLLRVGPVCTFRASNRLPRWIASWADFGCRVLAQLDAESGLGDDPWPCSLM